MPRAIDLNSAPPPQATCCACGSIVRLDRRARLHGRFRCPVCRTDNRVGADGVGQPLRGPAESADQMPQVRCTACGATNRLPYRYLQRGRYRCWSCQAVERVPRTLRRRARVGEGAWVALLCTVTAVAMGVGTVRTVRVLRAVRDSIRAVTQENLDVMQATIQIDSGEELPPTGVGRRFLITGSVRNTLPVRATIHVSGEVGIEQQAVAGAVVSLPFVQPGETREFRIVVSDPSGADVNSVLVKIIGVS